MDNLVLPTDEEKRKAYEAARQLPVSADGKKWRLGEQDFEALMKHLDNVVSCLCHSVYITFCSQSLLFLQLSWGPIYKIF